MATIANDELKERLKASGLWGDFVRRRHDLCESEGLTSRAAATKVLMEIDPEAVSLLKGRGRPKKNTKAVAASAVANALGANGLAQADGGVANLTDRRTKIADVKLANRDRKLGGVKKHTEDRVPEYVVTKETFSGKSCSYSVSLNWAYSNYRIADISPADAPSAVAWNLLLDIRESPSFKADVLKGWSNAMARKAEADEQKDRFDGEGEYDILAALAAGGGE